MLKEVANVRQIAGESRRRWFHSTNEDLIAWYAADGSLTGFQFCYERERHERALTWRSGKGYAHQKVDDGETVGLAHKRAPILVADAGFDAGHALERFMSVSDGLPGDIVSFVSAKLKEYPNDRDG